MNKENLVLILWDECRDVFLSADNKQLKELLKSILEIVKKNYDIFCEKADLEFLDFIVEINVDEYLVGTNGDNFELRLKTYIQQDNTSIENIWKMLSQLIWDLIIPVTDKVCPLCQCDNLALLVDKKGKHMYEYCENCFWLSKGGIQIMRSNSLFPANKEMFETSNYQLLTQKRI